MRSLLPKSTFMFLLLFIFTTASNQPTQRNKRHLLEKKDLNDICDKGSEVVRQYYKDYRRFTQNKEYKKNKQKALLNIIDGGGIEELKSYLIRLLPYLLFIVLGLILFIPWIILCVCFCCPFCCFKPINKTPETLSQLQVQSDAQGKTNANANANTNMKTLNTNNEENDIIAIAGHSKKNSGGEKKSIMKKNQPTNNTAEDLTTQTQKINNTATYPKQDPTSGCEVPKYKPYKLRKCSFVSLAFSYSFIGFAIVFSIISILLSRKAYFDLCDSICAVGMFGDDIILGQYSYVPGYTPSPTYWAGWEEISNIWTELKTVMSSITTTCQAGFTNTDWFSTDPDDFYDSLQTMYIAYKDWTIPNTNPDLNTKDGKTDLSPLYLEVMGPYIQAYTPLNRIFDEYNIKIVSTTLKIKSIELYCNNISAAGSLDSIIDSMIGALSDVESMMSLITDTAMTYLHDFFYTYLMLLIKVFVSLMLLLIFFHGLLLITFSVYLFAKIPKIKCWVHFAWNINIFLLIFTFIWGSIFGIISRWTTDVNAWIRYAFSPENILSQSPDLIGGGDIASWSVCLNGDGDWFSVYNTNNSVDNMKLLYDMYLPLKAIKEILSVTPQIMDSIAEIKDEYDYIAEHYTVITNKDTSALNDITEVFTEFNKYTVAGRYQTACIQQTTDLWCVNKDQCLAGFKYLKRSEMPTESSNKNTLNCLIPTEWTPEDAKKRYINTCTVIGGYFNTAHIAAEQYINALKDLYTSNKNWIEGIKSNLDAINGKYVATVNKWLISIDEAMNVVQPIYDWFTPLINEGDSWFEFMNCKIMKNDLDVIYKKFGDDFGKALFDISLLSIFSGLFQLVGITSILVVMFHYKTKVNFDKKRMDEKEEKDFSIVTDDVKEVEDDVGNWESPKQNQTKKVQVMSPIRVTIPSIAMKEKKGEEAKINQMIPSSNSANLRSSKGKSSSLGSQKLSKIDNDELSKISHVSSKSSSSSSDSEDFYGKNTSRQGKKLMTSIWEDSRSNKSKVNKNYGKMKTMTNNSRSKLDKSSSNS